MRSPRPIIGISAPHRTFAPRTSWEAFGSNFYVPRKRRIDADHVIGIVCAAIVIGFMAAWAAGVVR